MSISNPSLPLWTPFPNGCRPDDMIHIRGHVTYGTNAFSINLCDGQEYGFNKPNILFHFNPRMNSGKVVRNSRSNTDVWGPEETYPEVNPFVAGQDFDVLILAEPGSYKVAVNGRHFIDFPHRMPLYSCKWLNIDGSIRIYSVEFKHKSSTFFPTPTGAPYVPTVVPIPGPIYPTGPTICPPVPAMPYVTPGVGGRTPVYNPTLPYSYPMYGGVTPGTVIRIQGTPTFSGNQCFVVNLQCGTNPYPPPDIGLHVSTRFHERKHVLNTRHNNGVWGNEHVNHHFTLMNGVPFQMVINVQRHEYHVSVDGHRVGTIPHRIKAMSRIDTLQIEGDLVVNSITFN